MEDNIQEMYEKARKAFEVIEFWPQEKVDEMVLAVGWEFMKEPNREKLAKLAVEGSGIGDYESKKAKIWSKTMGTLRDQVGVKTCGVVEEFPEKGLIKLAKPIGVIANVVPCTNPESTICCLSLSTLKTRNAMIVSPHPRTQEASYETVQVARKGLKKVGAPEDLVQCIRHTSNSKTSELMAACDFAVATGGAALHKVVYQAGVPAHTVGAGNVVSFVDETADLKAAAQKIRTSKTANNSASCSSENAVAIYEGIYDEMMAALKAEGGHLLSTEEREKLRAYMWPDGHTLNRDVVASPVQKIAKAAGLSIPENTKFMMVLGEKVGPEDRFSGEKLSLTLTVWKYSDFSEMVQRERKILKFSGEGHSVSIHSRRQDRILELAKYANVGRVVCNQPHCHANSGGWHSGLPATDTLGGGTWAGNMTSENVNWKHFLNYTYVAKEVPEQIPTEEWIFGSYFLKWGRD
ncbi:MAG: aldehyde dehydrogenase family protein [Desulfobacteraceae bacterium]|nr:aldehyde dehydrogenase family protein [Desulfobacteraceae bacterium]